MWAPSSSELGTHAETETFSHTIQYYTESGGEIDPLTGLPGEVTQTYYTVRITPQEDNPASIVFTTGISATVGGHYGAVFNDQLTVRGNNNDFTTLTTLQNGAVFESVNRASLHEVISFKADTTRSRTFTYLAEALDGSNYVVASQTYTILCRDLNWSPGKDALKELVSYARSL